MLRLIVDLVRFIGMAFEKSRRGIVEASAAGF